MKRALPFWRLSMFSTLACLLVVALIVSSMSTINGAAAGQDTTSVVTGVYTEEQAERGRTTYRQECSGCHMDDLLGDGVAPSLVGKAFYFRWSQLFVADMLMAVRSTMPQGAPGSLSVQAYTDVIAYLFRMNKLPAGSAELPADSAALQTILIEEPAEK